MQSSPAIFDGYVIFGSDDGSVYALDAESGEKQWQFDTGGKVRSSPNVFKPNWVEHGILAIGSHSGGIYLLDVRTSEVLRKISTEGEVFSSPFITLNPRNRYYVMAGSTDGRQYGTYLTPQGGPDPDNYEPPFETSPQSPIRSSLVPRADYYETPGHFYGNDDGSIRKWSEGSRPWVFETGGPVRSSLALSHSRNVVYAGSHDRHIYAITDPGGEEKWSYETGGKVNSSPALVGDTSYVGSGDHHVYALGADAGQERWSYRTGGPVHSSPAVVAGTVFVGSDDGFLYALTTCQ